MLSDECESIKYNIQSQTVQSPDLWTLHPVPGNDFSGRWKNEWKKQQYIKHILSSIYRNLKFRDEYRGTSIQIASWGYDSLAQPASNRMVIYGLTSMFQKFGLLISYLLYLCLVTLATDQRWKDTEFSKSIILKQFLAHASFLDFLSFTLPG